MPGIHTYLIIDIHTWLVYKDYMCVKDSPVGGAGVCVLSPTPISQASANKGSCHHHSHRYTHIHRETRIRRE